jgi:hypothetical protein
LDLGIALEGIYTRFPIDIDVVKWNMLFIPSQGLDIGSAGFDEQVSDAFLSTLLCSSEIILAYHQSNGGIAKQA